jgi:transposase
MLVRAGLDSHKKRCTTSVFADQVTLMSSPLETFIFKTTKQGVSEFMQKVPEGSTVVIESSTTGKAISRMLSGKYEVHMIAPPERKPSVKTDRRDSERMVKEDAMEYVRRCYIPSQYVESLRFIISKQMEIGEKISRAKDQIHALIERNMLQREFDDLSDIFGREGLDRLSSLELPPQEMTVLAMYLEELRLLSSQHNQVATEIAKIAQTDTDCQLVMSHLGIASFVAVAIKARVGADASRFPTKKHFCSYAGVVPKADDSGEHKSEHGRVKRGDSILKYALTCGVRGAVAANADSGVKRFYLKQLKKGKNPQDSEVAAARKLACIVWKILTFKQRYVEEDKYLTARKMKRLSYTANRIPLHVTRTEDVPNLISELRNKTDILGRYTKDMHRALEHRRKRKIESAASSRGSKPIARGGDIKQ